MSLRTDKLAFDDFLLDREEKVLFYKKSPVSITPKIYEILHVLLTNHGHLIEKERLLNEVWNDVAVEEGNLTFTISRLRKILGDDALNPKYIETVSGRGYRFIADVSRINTNESTEVQKFVDKIGPDSLENKSEPKRYFVRYGLVFLAVVFGLILSAAIFVDFPSLREAKSSGKRFEFRLSKINGKNLRATISPDGRSFAYTDEVNEKVGVWLQNINTSEKRQLIPPGSFSYFGLTFSHNGNLLYFVRRDSIKNEKADIYRISVSGGEPEKIIETTEGWIGLSPDDSLITFLRKDKNDNVNLYIANTTGHNERKLLTKEFPKYISGNTFSPDGRSIAYGSGHSDDGKSNFSLMKFDLEKNIETEISSSRFYVIRSLVWMPDGNSIFFTARESPGRPYRIRQVDVDSGKTTEISSETAKYTDLSADKTGKHLLTVHKKHNLHLVVHNFTGLRERKILANANTAHFRSDSQIVYSTEDGEIFEVGIDGEKQIQLTSNNAINWSPLLSPDGNYIFYLSNQSGSYQIWRMKKDGTGKRQITKKSSGHPGFFSSDGRFLFYRSNLTSTLWRVRADGAGRDKEIWDKKLLNPVLSKDQSKIAYLHLDRKDNRRTVIEIADFQKKSLIRRIKLPGKHPVKLDWLTNNTIVYISRDTSGNKLWKQRLDAKSPNFIMDLGEELIKVFSVSPDGKSFILISGERFYDIVLVEEV